MKATILAMLWLIAVVAGSVVLGQYLAKDETCTYTYSGREVFQTQEEYREFKVVMSQEGMKWWQMDVLSSDPPIVAEFKVEVAYGVDVPYGEVSKNHYWPLAFMGIGMGIILPLVVAASKE